MSHVGGATCRMTPISRSALEMNPMPGHLFEGNPVGEGTKRRVTDTPKHLLERPAVSTHSLSRALRPPERLKRQAEFRYSDKTRPDSPVPTLQGPCGRSLKRRGSLRFPCPPPSRLIDPLCPRPSCTSPPYLLFGELKTSKNLNGVHLNKLERSTRFCFCFLSFFLFFLKDVFLHESLGLLTSC